MIYECKKKKDENQKGKAAGTSIKYLVNQISDNQIFNFNSICFRIQSFFNIIYNRVAYDRHFRFIFFFYFYFSFIHVIVLAFPSFTGF